MALKFTQTLILLQGYLVLKFGPLLGVASIWGYIPIFGTLAIISHFGFLVDCLTLRKKINVDPSFSINPIRTLFYIQRFDGFAPNS